MPVVALGRDLYPPILDNNIKYIANILIAWGSFRPYHTEKIKIKFFTKINSILFKSSEIIFLFIVWLLDARNNSYYAHNPIHESDLKLISIYILL